MNTKKKYIAPALNLFMVQAEVGYAGSRSIDLFLSEWWSETPQYTNNQERWLTDEGDNWSTDWSWDD